MCAALGGPRQSADWLLLIHQYAWPESTPAIALEVETKYSEGPSIVLQHAMDGLLARFQSITLRTSASTLEPVSHAKRNRHLHDDVGLALWTRPFDRRSDVVGAQIRFGANPHTAQPFEAATSQPAL